MSTSRWVGNLPLAFYAAPTKARLVVPTAEAREILLHYEGTAPTYIGLGVWRLKARSLGAGVVELTCQREAP